MTIAALETFMNLVRTSRGNGWINPWSEWVDGIDIGPAAAVFPTPTPIPRTSSPGAGNNHMRRDFGFCENTATTVWGELLRRPGAARQVVLWNAFAFHPHEPGRPLTNRRPRVSEVEEQVAVLQAFLRIFPARVVVAVGEVSQRRLAAMGVEATAVRHPSFGDRPEFIEGFGSVLDGVGVTVAQGSLDLHGIGPYK